MNLLCGKGCGWLVQLDPHDPRQREGRSSDCRYEGIKPHYLATITSEALTAIASSPTAKPRSSIASLVIEDVSLFYFIGRPPSRCCALCSSGYIEAVFSSAALPVNFVTQGLEMEAP